MYSLALADLVFAPAAPTADCRLPTAPLLVPGVGLCRPLFATGRFVLLADRCGRPLIRPAAELALSSSDLIALREPPRE